LRRAIVALLLLAAPLVARADEGGTPSPPAAEVPDAFAKAMADAGLDPASIGYRGKGTWARWPRPPYRMPFFDDLLADPRETYEFTRTLGEVVAANLTPASLAGPIPDGQPGSLFALGVALATDRRTGGFRGFGIGVVSDDGGLPTTLPWAVRALRRTPRPEEDARAGAGALTRDLDAALGRYVQRLADAHEWIERGLRRTTLGQRIELFGLLPELIASTSDATQYFPVVDDLAREVDEPSLWYGCLKAMAATQRARSEIQALRPADGWGYFEFEQASDLGDVVVLSGGGPFRRATKESGTAPFLFVSLGASPSLPRPVAATTPTQSLSVALVVDGVPRKVPAAESKTPTPRSNDHGCGVLGCGLYYAAGSGKDEYDAESWAMGAGLFGLGCLVDEGGDDVYRMRASGQGMGYFGAGLLLDAAGDDRYELLSGDGQGLGCPGGIGVLADGSGNDRYFAERSPAKAGEDRADYHSQKQIVVSNAQGVGVGRRGDLTDGHDWAGGLGALIDVDGDDVYEAGNFSQGLGYWFGTGLLWDGGGNDRYDSVYFTQGSGAHFAVGALVDEGGDDVHALAGTAGAALGFGWDVVNALFLDRGAGNDRYEAKMISIGVGEVRSHGWFVDEGGDDTYVMDEGALAFGAVDRQDNYVTPNPRAPFSFHLAQTGLFLDLGGKDRYLRRPRAGGDPVPDAAAGDGRTWGEEAPVGKGAGRNVALGRDLEAGRIGFLDAWPARAPRPGPGTASPPTISVPAMK
jgi:hypothetical protein